MAGTCHWGEIQDSSGEQCITENNQDKVPTDSQAGEQCMTETNQDKIPTDSQASSPRDQSTPPLCNGDGQNEVENLTQDVGTMDLSDTVKGRMLDRVAKSDGHFKHQQRGEPDLTHKDKLSIATELLDKKPTVFLTRFGKFLIEDDLIYFDFMKGDYMVDFHMKEIRKQLDDRKNEVRIRNRRYEAMKKLLAEGEYFSDEEMKYRDPLLYEQMVGQYLNQEELDSQVDKSDLRFSTILLQHMDILHNNAVHGIQKAVEEGQMEEEESEEEDEQEVHMEDDEEKEGPKIAEDEKQMLRHEFLTMMQWRFLHGEDSEFDYSEVDGNVEFDSLDIQAIDEQEKYFDEEDESETESMSGSLGSERTDTQLCEEIAQESLASERTDTQLCEEIAH